MTDWRPPSNPRRKQIIASAVARGLVKGTVACTIPGCSCHGRSQALFELDDLIELYGPPPHGLPLDREAVGDYAKRAQRDLPHRLVAMLNLRREQFAEKPPLIELSIGADGKMQHQEAPNEVLPEDENEFERSRQLLERIAGGEWEAPSPERQAEIDERARRRGGGRVKDGKKLVVYTLADLLEMHGPELAQREREKN